jgi:hypothetical protein
VPGSIFADCCSADRGRPSIPPSQLAGALLGSRTGLSDERATAAVAWDRRRQIALRLPVDHGRSNPSTLTRYRARLSLHGRERLALENSLALAAEPGNSPPRRSGSSFDPAEGRRGRRRPLSERRRARRPDGARPAPPAAQPPPAEGVPQVGQPMVDLLQEPPLRSPGRSGWCPSLGARRRRYGSLPPVPLMIWGVLPPVSSGAPDR